MQKSNKDKTVADKNNFNSKIVKDIVCMPPSDTDPEGSYTGKPKDKYEKPTQDADDL